MLRAGVLAIGQVHNMRIAISGGVTGAPVREQQNGENKNVSDDKTTNPHSIP
jgi:hypothetical protein